MRTDQAYTGNGDVPVLAVSLELAAAKWKVALHDGRREKPAVHTVPQPQAAARLQATLDLIEIHKEKWSLPEDVRIVSYEAGQDAFWICRALRRRHIECHVVVVDPASIPVERHQRRAKTDRLDVIKLVINLRAWLRGERDRMHVVHMPSQEDEATRHLMRERGQLQKEILQHRDRMRKLVTIGCWDAVDHRTFAGRLERGEVHCHDGAPLPRELHERLLRECERLALVKHQLAVLEKTRQTNVPALARKRDPPSRRTATSPPGNSDNYEFDKLKNRSRLTPGVISAVGRANVPAPQGRASDVLVPACKCTKHVYIHQAIFSWILYAHQEYSSQFSFQSRDERRSYRNDSIPFQGL